MAADEPKRYVLNHPSLDVSVRKDLKIHYLVQLIAERSRVPQGETPAHPAFLMPTAPRRTNHHASMQQTPPLISGGTVAIMGRFANAIMVTMACIGLASSLIFVGSLFNSKTETIKAAPETGYTRTQSEAKATQTPVLTREPRLSPTAAPVKATMQTSELPPATGDTPGMRGDTSRKPVVSGAPAEAVAQAVEAEVPPPERTSTLPTATAVPQARAYQSEAPSASYKVHTVQKGENLFRIALQYGTTVKAIVSANNIADETLIYAGQRLVIPQ